MLHILDLSLNSLSGSIPRCFHNFTTMVDRHAASMIQRGSSSSYVSGNYVNSILLALKGKLLQYKGSTLALIRAIDLSRNKLTGEFPEEITNLEALYSLNISSNQLYGVIPPKIGNMKMLESLDLSRNKFSGEIPPAMVTLVFMSALDLSYNNLSGRIPLGNQFQSFDASTFTGNSDLCGVPLESECHEDAAINGSGINGF
ncbi:hypothetical protein LguiA_018500 [Lonicera macranthoides]